MLQFLQKIIGKPIDFRMLIDKGALIVDVRTPHEFSEGHIQGAVNIPLANLKNKMTELRKKNSVVILCCRSGTRSAMATSLLKAGGVESYNGGAWQRLLRKIS